MYTPRCQRTIASPVAVEGFGYWSGRDVRVEFHPAPVDAGIVFVRCDLDPPIRIEATVKNRVEVPRRTSLRSSGASVEMIEHVMASLSGLQVDNCEIRVNEPEMPGFDGSSLPFVEVLDRAGIVAQDALRPVLVVRELTRLGDDECWIEARPAESDGLTVKFRIDYGRSTPIGRQTFQLAIDPETFRSQLAPSRTFMLKEEADWLLAQGLGRRATPKDLLIFDRSGPVDNQLRYPDECARHKALDLVGDLALAGCDLVGYILAHRSGHRLNADLVRALLSEGDTLRTWRRSA
ncbi:MAG: UDP-3-O-acyl-N-acetylglucosamine deacetylase [Pirellulales bacterium]